MNTQANLRIGRKRGVRRSVLCFAKYRNEKIVRFVRLLLYTFLVNTQAKLRIGRKRGKIRSVRLIMYTILRQFLSRIMLVTLVSPVTLVSSVT